MQNMLPSPSGDKMHLDKAEKDNRKKGVTVPLRG